MKYLLLIYTPEDPTAQATEPDPAEMQVWFDYTQAMIDAGVHVAGEALLPTATATTVQVRDGKTLHTDGPFAETKEVLGGFYMVDVDDLDAALDWAARCPASTSGSIEVRPVAEFDLPS